MINRQPARRPAIGWPCRRQGVPRGLSIVELMVGIAIGLFILASSSLVLTTQLGDNRRLLLEAQIQQDLRAAADMIAHDLRRAGYWAKSYCQVWPGAQKVACATQLNPYDTMTPEAALEGTSSVVYARSTDEEGMPIGTDDDTLSESEQAGFRLNASTGAIEFQVGGSWQALTDSAVLRVTQFSITLNAQALPFPCGVQCPVSAAGCPLVLVARDATVVIVAQAVHEVGLQRTLRDVVRLRNDVPRPNCPAPGP
jgi:type IV pilus assembly protein PilW